ncbi:MAG: cysteine desulfurase [Nitrospinae bacterium]|nr:cysteine desulfurase [Nitrospinota bacterium]
MNETAVKQTFDVERTRRDFPMLRATMNGARLVYLDNAATALKPLSVTQRMYAFETGKYATVRRGSYRLGEEATELFEETRRMVGRFVNSSSPDGIIFTSGATQSINLVAVSLGGLVLREGDEVIISGMEHHANIVPWQRICETKGATLKIIPVTDDGELDMDIYSSMLNPRVKLVAVTHVSNVLGTINPVKEIVAMAREHGAYTLVDGAQAAPHMKVDVQDIGCDFYAFSSHKLYGPTGLGVLYGRMETLDIMPPYVTGGDMIERVTFEKTTFKKPPGRFEAGTPPITQVIGLAEAIKYVQALGMDNIEEYGRSLLEYGHAELEKIPGLAIIGQARRKAAIISFTLEGVHPHDVVTILDGRGLALRGGHHCAQPLMDRFGVPATTRASMAFYNTFAEISELAAGIRTVVEIFR